MECTRYTSAREILRNSTFLRHAAKCERAICKQSIASPAENRCNQEQPSITSNGVVLGFFYVAFRGFFEDKIAYVPFVFLCRIDILRSTHHGNCALSWSKNENFSLYGEKVREEKEGESRLWERCVNRFFGFPRFP